jgi:hypothetical protein
MLLQGDYIAALDALAAIPDPPAGIDRESIGAAADRTGSHKLTPDTPQSDAAAGDDVLDGNVTNALDHLGGDGHSATSRTG